MDKIIELLLIGVIAAGVWYEFGGRAGKFGDYRHFIGPASVLEFTKLPIDYVPH